MTETPQNPEPVPAPTQGIPIPPDKPKADKPKADKPKADKPKADKPKAKPAKKAAAKKAPAKPAKKAPRQPYLPALPDDFEYTVVTITGPDDASIDVEPGVDGKVRLLINGSGLSDEREYDDMSTAVKAAALAAKGMAELRKREADVARAREQALDLP